MWWSRAWTSHCLNATLAPTFSQLHLNSFSASGKAAERRNSFLRPEVFTLAGLLRGLTLRGIQLSGTSEASWALQCFCWSASESAHSREAVKILLNRQQESRELLVIKCHSVVPSWESSGILHALNAYRTQSQILQTSQMPYSMDTRIHFSKSQWFVLPVT